MCMPPKNRDDRNDSAARTTLLSTIAMGAAMLLACAAGPLIIGAAGGALAVGTLGLAGGALTLALCLAAPLGLWAWRASRTKDHSDEPASA